MILNYFTYPPEITNLLQKRGTPTLMCGSESREPSYVYLEYIFEPRGSEECHRIFTATWEGGAWIYRGLGMLDRGVWEIIDTEMFNYYLDMYERQGRSPR